MLGRIASAAIGLAAMACSGSTAGGISGGDVGGSSSGGGLTAQQACQDRAHALCTRYAGCAPERILVLYGDEPTCEARNASNCTNALSAPSTANTPAATEACAQAYAGWSCTDFIDNENLPTACAPRNGSVAGGGACGFNGQCQSGFCAIAPTSLCGTCATPPAAGDSCAQLTSCGPGLVCTTDTMTCVVLAAQGAACGKGAPCGDGLYCVGEQPTKEVQGSCQPAVEQLGGACDPTGQTGPGCDRNQLLTCDVPTKQCATIAVGVGGQPCGTNDVNGQTALCSGNGLCIGSSTGTPGTCTAAAADGAACDTQNGPGCQLLARCVVTSDGETAGTCQLSSSSCQ
jgi:hypothetical protein